jgi:hypothetical protein
LEHGFRERLGAQVRDLLVLGVGDHAAERLAGGIADEQDGVPVLALLGHERRAAVPGVEDLAAVAGEEGLGQGLGLLVVGLATALGEAEQVEHHDRTARVLLEVALEVRTAGVDRHMPTLLALLLG